MTYGYFYNTSQQVINVGSSFAFDNNRDVMGGVGHIPGTADIWVWDAGDYFITGNCFHLEPLQLTIFRNNVPLEGASFGDQLAATDISYSRLIRIRPSNITEPCPISPTGLAALIQIRNWQSFTPINQDGHDGTGQLTNITNLNLTLILLNPNQPEP